jgi:hypothetical protein
MSSPNASRTAATARRPAGWSATAPALALGGQAPAARIAASAKIRGSLQHNGMSPASPPLLCRYRHPRAPSRPAYRTPARRALAANTHRAMSMAEMACSRRAGGMKPPRKSVCRGVRSAGVWTFSSGLSAHSGGTVDSRPHKVASPTPEGPRLCPRHKDKLTSPSPEPAHDERLDFVISR